MNKTHKSIQLLFVEQCSKVQNSHWRSGAGEPTAAVRGQETGEPGEWGIPVS